MKKLTSRQKLELIDGLCLCYESSSETHDDAKRILSQIYRVAHPHQECSHPEWENTTVELAKSLRTQGIVNVFRKRKAISNKRMITFDKSALPFMCEALKVPYDPNIIAFTKKGPVVNLFDLLESC